MRCLQSGYKVQRFDLLCFPCSFNGCNYAIPLMIRKIFFWRREKLLCTWNLFHLLPNFNPSRVFFLLLLEQLHKRLSTGNRLEDFHGVYIREDTKHDRHERSWSYEHIQRALLRSNKAGMYLRTMRYSSNILVSLVGLIFTCGFLASTAVVASSLLPPFAKTDD